MNTEITFINVGEFLDVENVANLSQYLYLLENTEEREIVLWGKSYTLIRKICPHLCSAYIFAKDKNNKQHWIQIFHDEDRPNFLKLTSYRNNHDLERVSYIDKNKIENGEILFEKFLTMIYDTN